MSSEVLSISLSVDEEFFLATGLVLNNWFALQVGLNQGNPKNEKVEKLFWTTFNSVLLVAEKLLELEDAHEMIEESMYSDLDIIVEDESIPPLLQHLLHIHQLILSNQRTQMIELMRNCRNKSHLLTREEIHFNSLSIERANHQSASITSYETKSMECVTLARYFPSLIITPDVCANDSEMAVDAEDSQPEQCLSIQPNPDGWVTVSRRKK